MPQIFVLSNPGSTSNQKSLSEVRGFLDDLPNVLHGELSDWRDIEDQLRRAAAANTDLLIINGGDGTIRQVVSNILLAQPFPVRPTLAVMPGGQTNMLAGDLGAKASPIDVLREIIGSWERGEATLAKRKILKIQRTPDEAPLFGFFFGTAAIISGIEFCREHIYPLNIPMFAAHAAVVGLLLSSALSGGAIGPNDLKPTTARIHVDDYRLSDKAYFGVIATTMDRLLLNLHPFSDQGEGSVKFSALEKGPLNVMRAVPKLLGLGKPGSNSDSYFFSRRANKVEILIDGPYTIDGEFYHPEPDIPITLEADAELTFVKL